MGDYDALVPPQNPVTRLRQIAIDLDRLADDLETETEFDPAIFRYLQNQLLDIAGEIEGPRSPAPDQK
jgi:hypothetical protein